MLATLRRTVAEEGVIVDMWDIDKQQIMAIMSFIMDKSLAEELVLIGFNFGPIWYTERNLMFFTSIGETNFFVTL